MTDQKPTDSKTLYKAEFISAAKNILIIGAFIAFVAGSMSSEADKNAKSANEEASKDERCKNAQAYLESEYPTVNNSNFEDITSTLKVACKD